MESLPKYNTKIKTSTKGGNENNAKTDKYIRTPVNVEERATQMKWDFMGHVACSKK